jgi:hypothetical protein
VPENLKAGLWVRLPKQPGKSVRIETIFGTASLQEVETITPPLARMITHAYLVGKELKAVHDNLLPAYVQRGGRIVYHVDDSVGDGWVEPFTVRPYSSDAHARTETRRVNFWADASGEFLADYDQPRYILPTVREDLVIEEVQDPVHNDFLWATTNHIFRNQMFPFVEVVKMRPSGGTSPLGSELVVPTYLTKTHEVLAVTVAYRRFVKNQVPQIILVPEPHVNRAFYVMLRRLIPTHTEAVHVMLLTLGHDTAASAQRQLHMRSPKALEEMYR